MGIGMSMAPNINRALREFLVMGMGLRSDVMTNNITYVEKGKCINWNTGVANFLFALK